MQAVILAAGLGTRLGSHTANKPKAMAEVRGKTLISRVFDFIGDGSFSEITVVAGYMGQSLASHVSKISPSARVLHNSDFRKGNILSLAVALEKVSEGFLLMNADHIYPRRMFKKIIPSGDHITAICDFDRTLGADDMKVKLGKSGAVEKISKQLTDYDCGYIGMTYCPASKLTTYKDAFKRVLESNGDSSNVESILGHLADIGEEVRICDASGFGWLEVDTPEELLSAETKIANNPDLLL